MGFTRKAYLDTGGFSKIKFSITEDYELFSQILQKGYSWQWLHKIPTCNTSKALKTIKEIFHQKKRWFDGGKKGPVLPAILFFYYSFFYPILFLAYFYFPSYSWFWISFLLIKIIFELLLLQVSAYKLGRIELLNYYLAYLFYSAFILIILPFYLILPGPIYWKGRTF